MEVIFAHLTSEIGGIPIKVVSGNFGHWRATSDTLEGNFGHRSGKFGLSFLLKAKLKSLDLIFLCVFLFFYLRFRSQVQKWKTLLLFLLLRTVGLFGGKSNFREKKY